MKGGLDDQGGTNDKKNNLDEPKALRNAVFSTLMWFGFLFLAFGLCLYERVFQ